MDNSLITGNVVVGKLPDGTFMCVDLGGHMVVPERRDAAIEYAIGQLREMGCTEFGNG